MRRSKRLRGSSDNATTHEPPKVQAQSILDMLPKDIFNSVLCPLLELPELVCVMRASKFLQQRITSLPFLFSAKRKFAAECRGWRYESMSDETALKRVQALIAKGEHCLACGIRAKGVHWPAEWQSGRFNLCRQMCIECFTKRNRVKLLKASVADSKFGLSPEKRKNLPYVEWNRGYQSRRRMYLESDLQALVAKKKSKK